MRFASAVTSFAESPRHAPGFSKVNASGKWSGLDIEFCSALAAAVLGNKDAVKFLSLTAGDKFKALQDNEVDVLMGATAWTLTRDTELGAHFVEVSYYDGQGFIVPRNHSISSVLELSGASICTLSGSSDESAIADFFGSRKMRYQLIKSERWDDLVKTYANGGCTVLTGDLSLLAYVRSNLANGAEHMLLPEIINKEPLGPYVQSGHDAWFSIVRWTFMALVAAEEFGINSSNVDMMKASPVHDIRRFLGLEADLGAPLGLAARLGLSNRQAGRQLLRDFRTYVRARLAVEARSRLEQSVDQGRTDVRGADTLTSSRQLRCR